MRPFAPGETVYLYADRKDGNWGRSGLGHLKLFVGWVLITKSGRAKVRLRWLIMIG